MLMMWQDLVFLAGSVLSIVFLAPTLQNKTARIPLGSSIPSLAIGSIYTVTYTTMGMTFSAVGSAGVAIMWSLIACYRSPGPHDGLVNISLFFQDLSARGRRVLKDGPEHEQSGSDQSHPAD
jgi:hypothetical protein